MTDSVENKIKGYYEEGLEYKKIADLVNKNRAWVADYIKLNLVDTDSQIKRKESLREKRYAPIKDNYELGFTTREISDRTGFQPHTITKYVRDYLLNSDSYLIRKGEMDRPDIAYQIKKGYVEGLGYSDIALSLGKSESYIEKYINKNFANTSLSTIRDKAIAVKYKELDKQSVYDRIKMYYEQGLSQVEICSKVERSRSSVIAYINKNLIHTDSYRIRKENIDKLIYDEIKECYDKGLSIDKAAKSLHRSGSIVSQYYHRFEKEGV